MTDIRILQITSKPEFNTYEFKYDYLDESGARKTNTVEMTQQFIIQCGLINFVMFNSLAKTGILAPTVYKDINECDG